MHRITEFDEQQLMYISTDMCNLANPNRPLVWRCRCRAAVRAGEAVERLHVTGIPMPMVVCRTANIERGKFGGKRDNTPGGKGGKWSEWMAEMASKDTSTGSHADRGNKGLNAKGDPYIEYPRSRSR